MSDQTGVPRDIPHEGHQCGILPQSRLAQPGVYYFILLFQCLTIFEGKQYLGEVLRLHAVLVHVDRQDLVARCSDDRVQHVEVRKLLAQYWVPSLHHQSRDNLHGSRNDSSAYCQRH